MKNKSAIKKQLALSCFVLASSSLMMGCSSTKSDMADAINKQLAESPKTITANITPEPVSVYTNIQGRMQSVAVFPDPAPATFDQYKSAYKKMGQAYADLAKAGFLTVQNTQGYADGSLGSNTVQMPGETSGETIMDNYIQVANPAIFDEPTAKPLIAAIKAQLEPMGLYNLTRSSVKFFKTLATLDSSKFGESEPDFFYAVDSDDQSTLPRELSALAAEGFLREQDANAYVTGGGFFGGGQTVFLNWAGGDNYTQYHKPASLRLFFLTPKAKGLVMMAPPVNQPTDTPVPSVRLYQVEMVKPLTVTSGQGYYVGSLSGKVNFEMERTNTPIGNLKSFVDAMSSQNKSSLSSIPEGKQIITAQVATSPNPSIRASVDLSTSNIASDKPVDLTVYAPKYEQIKMGEWDLKSVDNFEKDKDTDGSQQVFTTFEFHLAKGMSNDVVDAFNTIGVQVPKDGATQAFRCNLTAMDKGYISHGCFPSRN